MTKGQKAIRKAARAILAACLIMIGAGSAYAQSCALNTQDRARLEAEHLVGGAPTPGPVLVRRGYVTQYDAQNRVPRWVAWRAEPDYRNPVSRSGRWATFRQDPDVDNPVRDPDYTNSGFARGHLAPYFIAGGDRDRNSTRAPSDEFDACTIYEINYMTNIAPQYQSRFNGAGGLWYEVETVERTQILANGRSFNVIAGSIFGPEHRHIGPRRNIGVPDMFYRILVTPNGVVPFLFVHERRLDPAGCDRDARLEDCIVTIADIERLTGANFFAALPNNEERNLEASSGRETWQWLTGR